MLNVAQSRKTNCFISLSTNMTYRNNFSKKNMLGEKEVLVSDFSYPTLMFIKDILKKRQLGELTEGALALKVEVVRKFYANYKLFNLDDHFITSTII